MHMGEGVQTQEVFRAVPERHLEAMQEIVGALALWLERQAHLHREGDAWSLLRRMEEALYMGISGGWKLVQDVAAQPQVVERRRDVLSNLLMDAANRTVEQEEQAWLRGGYKQAPEEGPDGALIYAARVLWKSRAVLDGRLSVEKLARTVYAARPIVPAEVRP